MPSTWVGGSDQWQERVRGSGFRNVGCAGLSSKPLWSEMPRRAVAAAKPAERSRRAFVPRAKQLHNMRTPFVHLVSEDSDPCPLPPDP